MTCQDVRRQLALWATGDVPPAERRRLEAHLVSCRACREEAEAYRAAVDDVRASASPTPVRAGALARLRSAGAAAVREERRRTRRRRVVRLAAGLAATVLVGVAIGYVVDAVRGPSAEAGPSAERWRLAGVEAARTSPAENVVVRGDRLYAVRRGPSGGSVVAIDAAAGEAVWEVPLARPSHVAADGEHVLCVASGERGSVLVALGTADGRLAWRYGPDGGEVALRLSPPVPLDGGRVAWTVGPRVCVLDAATGRPAWTRALAAGPLSAATAAGGDLLVAGCGALYGLDPSSGRERWRAAYGAPLAPTLAPLLAAAGSRVYVAGAEGSIGGRLHCVDRASGRLAWSRRVPRPRHLLATAEGVYLRCEDVQALDEASGEPVWTCRADGCGPMTCTDGLIRFVDSGRDGRLVAVDRRTGRTAWEMPGLRSCGAFVAAGDTGYVRTWDGVVHAIALETR
ncbi:MAG: PQQ-binding-like beta-propeller repeat protein [Phycisphaerae bacterium]